MKRLNRHLIASAALAAATLTGGAAAQGGVAVVPSDWATTDAPGLDLWPFGAFEARRQLLVDAPLLGTARNRPLIALQVRRNGDGDALDAARVELEITLSTARGAARRASPRFADNCGQNAVTVFRGFVDLPACPPVPAGAAPWAPPYTVTIPFSTPFTLRGATLCIDTVTRLHVDPATGTPDEPWWPVDAFVRHEPVTVRTIGTSCWQGGSADAAGALGATFVPGSNGVFHLAATGGPRPATCVLGLTDQQFGSLSLPVSLDAVGAPGCWWYVAPMVSIPAPLEAAPMGPRAEARVEVPLPGAPSLAGLPLFAQWFVGDPAANALGIATTNAVRVDIGAAPPDDGFCWVESTDPNSPSGRLVRGRMPVLLLEHR